MGEVLFLFNVFWASAMDSKRAGLYDERLGHQVAWRWLLSLLPTSAAGTQTDGSVLGVLTCSCCGLKASAPGVIRLCEKLLFHLPRKEKSIL